MNALTIYTLRTLLSFCVLVIGLQTAEASCDGDPDIDAIVCADPELKALHGEMLKLTTENMRVDLLAYSGYKFWIGKRDQACRAAVERRTCLLDWYQKRVAAMPGEIEADVKAHDAILNPPDVWFTPHAGIQGFFRAGWSGDPDRQEVSHFDVPHMAFTCNGGYVGSIFCQATAELDLEATIARPFNAKGTCTLDLMATAAGDPYPVRLKHDLPFDWNAEGLRATESLPFLFKPALGYGEQPLLDARLIDYRCLITHIL